MREKLLLTAEIEIETPGPNQDPRELARLKLDPFREAVQPASKYDITLYEATEYPHDGLIDKLTQALGLCVDAMTQYEELSHVGMPSPALDAAELALMLATEYQKARP